MTLPVTPPITGLQLLTEFSIPLGTPASQFYSGGPWVPAANTNVNNKLPITGLSFLGASHTAGGGTGLSAAITPSTVYVETAQKTARSQTCVASLTGATGTVTGVWSLVSGDSSISISSTTSLSVTFVTSLPVHPDSKSATWQCLLTDSGTGKTGVATVALTFEAF